METFSLQISSNGNPTFHHNNGTSMSCIDKFAASNTLQLTNFQEHCTLETPLNLSSHDPITSSLVVKNTSEKQESKFSKTYSAFNRKKIIWEDSKLTQYQQLAAQALQEASLFWDKPEAIPLLCSLFSNLLVKCSVLVFNTKSMVKRKGPRRSKTIIQAEAKLSRAFKAWKRAGRPKAQSNLTKLSYTSARSDLQRTRRYEDNLHHIKQNNFLMHSNIHNKNKVFSRMKNARGVTPSTGTTLLQTPVGVFHGDDVLEGFAADAEFLGRPNEESPWFDHTFYRLCKLDNIYIFEFQDNVKISPMNLNQLNHILNTKMKPGKSCDVYHLTVEHLRNCGLQAKLLLLNLINRIIHDIHYLSCPQIKLGLGTAVHKGKGKPITKSNSYRRITVTPIIGAILDYHIEPVAESTFRLVQSPDQLGFTASLSYLMAAVQRGECQHWAVDNKLTCFGVSLDGEAAFPSVERDIQIRELYSTGERGDYLQYSRNTYKNTECHLKQEDKLSRKITEWKGNRQGHVRASGHFKAYINSCLTSLSDSKLGFWIGPICVTSVCIADDTYVLSGSPRGLQAALKIVSHYGRQYHLKFNADKTKIVVTGSKVDMEFYKETTPWLLNDETISVVDNNDHLGLVVSGLDEEQKNVDQNILQCRNSLFALLGPAFSYKCLLSPVVQIHLWRTYNLPVVLSGLSALPVRPPNIKSLALFHNKIMRGFLKLSKSSPIPGLHFLLGELPIEAKLHMETLTLFHNIWASPNTTVHEIVKYLLRMKTSSSTTWSQHVELLCRLYRLPCPLYLIESVPAWSKEQWKLLVKTRITVEFENKLRDDAKTNSKMTYLNVQVSGLAGTPHPALVGIRTTREAKKLRLHLKFLTGDFLTGERRSIDLPGSDPSCQLCLTPIETTEHILVTCRATAEVRERLLPELLNVVARVQPSCQILKKFTAAKLLAQFILDCTSLNLDNSTRVPSHNPGIMEIFRVSRDWCFALSNARASLLKKAQKRVNNRSNASAAQTTNHRPVSSFVQL